MVYNEYFFLNGILSYQLYQNNLDGINQKEFYDVINHLHYLYHQDAFCVFLLYHDQS